MLEIALAREEPWPDYDWDVLALAAAHAAVERTPHGGLATGPAIVEISVRLTHDAEVRDLNARYRHKDRATNVLSFPMVQPDLLDTVGGNGDADDGGAAGTTGGEVLLGDIVLAHGVCAGEAAERGIALADHVAHLLAHGTLHLLGYDHQGDAEAEAMEAIERDALAHLGLADPYRIED